MFTDLCSATYSLGHNVSHIVSEHYHIHSHPFYELYYFLSGDVHYNYAGTEYVMQPHTLVIVAPNVFHGIRSLTDAPYERFTFHFTEDIIDINRRQLLMGGLPTEQSIRTGSGKMQHIISNADQLGILPLMRDVERVIGMSEKVCDTMAAVILEAILGALMIHEGDLHSGANYPDYYIDQRELAPVLSFIHQNLTEKMSLDDLSACGHISKSKLNQLFRTQLGVTAMEYVNRRRLNYAQQLLLNGVSASMAASASGFGDYTNFYRAYVKLMGHSPIEDRHARSSGDSPFPVRVSMKKGSGSDGQNNGDGGKPNIWSLHKPTVISTDPAVLMDP